MQRAMRAAIGTQQHRQLLARLPLADLVRAAQVARALRRDRLVRRHRAGRRGAPHRREPDRGPPGRRRAHQAGGAARHEARHRSTRAASSSPTSACCTCGRVPGTNAAFLLGLAHVIVRDGLVDERFVAARTEGFEALADCSSPTRPPRSSGSRASRPPTSSRRRTSTARRSDASIALGPRRHRAQVRLRGRAADLQPRADDRQDRPARAARCCRCAARTTCRARPTSARCPTRTRAYRSVADEEVARAFEAALGRDAEARARAEDPRDVRRRDRGHAEGDVHLRRGHRPDRPEHGARRGRARSRSTSSSARTSSRPRPRSTRTSSCPRRRSSRRRGTFTNAERRLQLVEPAIDPPGEAKTDLEIFTARLARARARHAAGTAPRT